MYSISQTIKNNKTMKTQRMTPEQIKYINIQFKEWYDRQNANSYHAGTVEILANIEGRDRLIRINCPFAYGYDSAYEQTAVQAIREHVELNGPQIWALSRLMRENGLALRYNSSIERGCLKRDLIKEASTLIIED